jgi:hypothetical protein
MRVAMLQHRSSTIIPPPTHSPGFQFVNKLTQIYVWKCTPFKRFTFSSRSVWTRKNPTNKWVKQIHQESNHTSNRSSFEDTWEGFCVVPICLPSQQKSTKWHILFNRTSYQIQNSSLKFNTVCSDTMLAIQSLLPDAERNGTTQTASKLSSKELAVEM